ncbi:unnamed protein product [Rotaria sp. Silwood2]|nr:unnamed protein product [Rotaria sp. Silwood2]CAF4537481.1 unnamed protein product [Rotaria sp. Silwood2]
MIITVPRILRRSHIAFMLIEGGLNTDPIPTSSSVTDFGVSTGSVAVELRQIPNEPIRFMADPAQKSRTEDALIAWTWMTFIEQNGTNPYVLLRLPMTKTQNSTSITYSYTAPVPPSGYWDGMFIQITFPGHENTTLDLTTETLILPNTFPADTCTGDACYGILV